MNVMSENNNCLFEAINIEAGLNMSSNQLRKMVTNNMK